MEQITRTEVVRFDDDAPGGVAEVAAWDDVLLTPESGTELLIEGHRKSECWHVIAVRIAVDEPAGYGEDEPRRITARIRVAGPTRDRKPTW